jgi:hypothetical protein
VNRALVERGDGLFTLDAPQHFLGMPIHTRMSVVRLSRDELLLYSPVALDPAQQQAIRALGRVAWIVAPNLYHHLYAGECARAFPGAQLLASPGLAAKRPDVSWSGSVPERSASPWADVLDHLYLDGNPTHREVVLYHRPSRALIVADLLGNIRVLEGPLMKLFGWANGWGRLAPPRSLRRMVRDRPAAARSLRALLAWDIATVIPCHGEVASGVRTAELEPDFAWLLGATP